MTEEEIERLSEEMYPIVIKLLNQMNGDGVPVPKAICSSVALGGFLLNDCASRGHTPEENIIAELSVRTLIQAGPSTIARVLGILARELPGKMREWSVAGQAESILNEISREGL